MKIAVATLGNFHANPFGPELQVKQMLGRRASRAWGGLDCRALSRMPHQSIYVDVPGRPALPCVAGLQPGSSDDPLIWFFGMCFDHVPFPGINEPGINIRILPRINKNKAG